LFCTARKGFKFIMSNNIYVTDTLAFTNFVDNCFEIS